jgi:hypothetical protein
MTVEHPTTDQISDIAKEIGLQPRQVKFWFQNRRTQKKVTFFFILINIMLHFNDRNISQIYHVIYYLHNLIILFYLNIMTSSLKRRKRFAMTFLLKMKDWTMRTSRWRNNWRIFFAQHVDVDFVRIIRWNNLCLKMLVSEKRWVNMTNSGTTFITNKL